MFLRNLRLAAPALAAAVGASALLGPNEARAEARRGGLSRRTTVGGLAALRRRVANVEARHAAVAPTLAALDARLGACERDVAPRGDRRTGERAAAAAVGAGGTVLEQGVGKGGLPTLTLRHGASGASAELYLFGATVTSLKDGRDGEELLFVSKEAVFNGQKAIRGGIPLVFPKFGAGPCNGCDALPSHGFARTSAEWEPRSFAVDADGAAVLTLGLRAGAGGVPGWPHAFDAEYTVRLGGGGGGGGAGAPTPLLTTTFRVTNTGDAPFTYQNLQHTYLRVPDVAGVAVRGFEGAVFASSPYDFGAGGGSRCDAAPEQRIAAEKDAIYVDVGADVTLQPAYGARATVVGRSASVTGAGAGAAPQPIATDCVLWNPWADKARRTKDLGDDEFKHFVCVEPGIALAPGTGMVLLPGETGELVQTIARK